ncbi:transmembrane channel-like protein 8 isoform X3 [Ochotona princeps]|uniref:transmembrane channel-like protein 8 isoform X3 n=1 Tax=Ochotona princeps TaxID=9978 RepID=UPI00271535AC|nr:transmembrane channel-like protein 8 isoform X3 [Ochotona princeps]XP_058532405.1 transmembrane channel-like protein 8 isoform X3 [Ochotona princeps]
MMLWSEPESEPEPAADALWEQEVVRLCASRVPLRLLPYAMVDKRLIRQLREPEGAKTSRWQRWRRGRQLAARRLREATRRLARGFGLWERSLYEIGGLFGTGIQAYFTFLRFLLFLNLVTLLLTASCVLLPLAWLPPPDSGPTPNLTLQCPSRPQHQTTVPQFHNLFWNVLTGRAFNNTYLFYGAYRAGPENQSPYSVRLAYLLTPLASLLLCFCGTLQRMVKGLPRKPLLSRHYRAPLSAKVFSSWDFCIRVQEAAIIKKHEISNEFKVELEEGHRFLQVQQQSRAQRACHLLTHLRVNLLFGLLVAGAISAIFWATKYSQDRKEEPLFVLLQYLPPGVIALVNFLGPQLFVFLVQLEDYPPNTEVNLSLIWCVVLKLASLGMFFFSLGQTVLCVGGNKTSLLGELGGRGAVQADPLQLPADRGLCLPRQPAPEAAGGALLRPVLVVAGPGGVPGAQERAGHRGGADSHLAGPLLLPPAATAQLGLHLLHLLHQEVHAPEELQGPAAPLPCFQLHLLLPAGAAAGPAAGRSAPDLRGRQHPLLLGLRPLYQLFSPLAGGPRAGGPPAPTAGPACPALPRLPRLRLPPAHPAQPRADRVRVPVAGQCQGHS